MASTHIMVIDDDAAFRDLMTDALSEEGYQVTTAADRATAFDRICASHPQLIMLDVRMATPRSGQVLLDLLAARAQPPDSGHSLHG